MLDHISIQCADAGASATFYDAVLAPLGGVRVMEFEGAIGYGIPPMPTFWIAPQQTGEGFREAHIAFVAPDRAAVRAFFEAAQGTGAEVLNELLDRFASVAPAGMVERTPSPVIAGVRHAPLVFG